MKKKYRVTGIDCANCAMKAELAVSKVKGVQSAALNFFTQTLLIEVADEGSEEIIAAALKALKKREPDAVIKEL